MPKIEFRDREEEIEIGQLFCEMGYDFEEPQEVKNEWPVQVLSFDTYYAIEGYRTVEKQKTIKLTTECGKELEGSLDHIVLTHETGWTKLKDLEIGQKLISHDHSPIVKSLEYLDEEKKLYDFQVNMAHSFMTNGILSHNSHFLVQMGANAMRNGKNVLHYTLELTEQAVGIRYDSNLCDIPASDIIDNKHQVIDFYKNNTELGRLMIKEYPTGTATVTTIRNHVEKLSLRNFKPSVILIDYADIMRSTRQFDSLRHELKLIYEELRNLAMELRIPIWTASQANRDSANSDIVGLENMSEAYGKAMVADFVVSLSRKPSEKAVGTGRLFIAKNRAGKDGILFPIHIDTSRSQVKVFDTESITLVQAHQDDKEEAKELIRRKWKEINNI